MLLVQVYLYFVSFPQDKKKYKALVLVLLMLENMQTGLVMFDAISAFAEGFGDTADLENIRMQWLSVPVLSALISCPVQFFYAYRVRILSQSKVKAGLLIFLSAAQGIASLAGGIPQARLHGKVTDLEGKRFSPVVIWLAMTCLCDVSIAASMLYYLRTRDTELKSTQILIQRVKKVVLETGALTGKVLVFLFPLPPIPLILTSQSQLTHTQTLPPTLWVLFLT
ncbi:hypothetical protein K435DRAFT_730628 [Dendrothele bispora CBS 962.96]|uniref:DUF6534 domain-containing protein n=1 Tax=Dendrothele bispora (strain CBS 962.96) TaxID=1314807 RepID=A0A4S8LFS4_DENBC|nr:hypothetical protein K435DRAFT_730628 [Dendrothele bispora CBS 962.96]